MRISSFGDFTRSRPAKSRLGARHKTGCRNNLGRLTSRHRGGGHNRRFRIIDFRRNKIGVPARVVSIEYDPNRTARIALLQYADGEKRYILAPVGLNVGASVVTDDAADITPGNSLTLRAIPLGTWLHNLELNPGRGGQLCRSSGTFAPLMAKDGDYVTVRLPSGEMRKINADCRASIGQVGNIEHENRIIGKAGRSRWLGVRPAVRGTAMHPIEHPHRVGEGRATGQHPVRPWAKPTKGYQTRLPKNHSYPIMHTSHPSAL